MAEPARNDPSDTLKHDEEEDIYNASEPAEDQPSDEEVDDYKREEIPRYHHNEQEAHAHRIRVAQQAFNRSLDCRSLVPLDLVRCAPIQAATRQPPLAPPLPSNYWIHHHFDDDEDEDASEPTCRTRQPARINASSVQELMLLRHSVRTRGIDKYPQPGSRTRPEPPNTARPGSRFLVNREPVTVRDRPTELVVRRSIG